MKVKVNQEACIGCGACAAICDKIFKINDEGLSVAVVKEVPKEEEQAARDAIDSCPTGAIVEE